MRLVIFIIILGATIAYIYFDAYHRLVTQRNRYKKAYTQIDIQLQRRYDLIPNLVNTAKVYLAHERETLEAVIFSRNRAFTASSRAAINPGDPAVMKDLSQAEGSLTVALGKLFALRESYPNLESDATIRQLIEELTSTQNRAVFARQVFNDMVKRYNKTRAAFPMNIIANQFGFSSAELLREVAVTA